MKLLYIEVNVPIDQTTTKVPASHTGQDKKTVSN